MLGSFATSVAVIYIAAEDSNAKLFIIILSSLSAVFTLTSFACNPTQYMRCYRKGKYPIRQKLNFYIMLQVQ